MTVNVEDYKRQTECVYKEEHYSVRDNGAVFRHSRKNKPLRKYDSLWTFGTPNNYGYLLIVSEVVHRIVAYAFLGKPPTSQHVIDHIDTNRQNNRPENLRWLTKLENILKNPITLKKIVFCCGSIEAFLKDPSVLNNFESEDRNFGWMRTVTPEEAQTSLKRLNNWAKKENSSTLSTGVTLGEWLFQDNQNSSSIQQVSEHVASITPNAIQKDWKTPCEFPCCPQTSADNPIIIYAASLTVGQIFSRNQYSSSIVADYATSIDKNTLWVMCKNSKEDTVKPWSLAQVTFENNFFLHTNLGSFFEKNGAEKQFTLTQGLEWTGGDTFDDLT